MGNELNREFEHAYPFDNKADTIINERAEA
jgi:hypothetical protein